MPTIPEFAESKNAFPDAPPSIDINPERLGRDAQALAQLGGEVGAFGGKLMQVRKQAMESDAVAQRRTDSVQWLANTENELRMSYTKTNENGEPLLGPDGQAIYDVEGFSNAMKEKLDQRMAEDLKAMPTGDAQRAYRDTVQPMFDRSYVGSVQWENTTRAMTYRKNIATRIDTNANFLINNPNLENTRNSLDALREGVNSQIGTVLTPGEAQEIYKSGAKTYVDALFRGYAQSPAKAKEGLMILNHISELAPRDPKTGEFIMTDEKSFPEAGTAMGKDAQGNKIVSGGGMKSGMFGSGIDPMIVQTSLQPDDIDRIRQRLLSVTDEADKFKASELRSQLQSYASLITDPKPGAVNYFSQQQKRNIINGFDALAKAGKVSRSEADEAAVTLALGESYMTVRNQMWSMAPSEIAKYDKLLEKEYQVELKMLGRDDPAFAYEHKRKYDAINEAIKNKIMGARKSDPSGYIEAHFGNQGQGSISQEGIPDAKRINWRSSVAKSLEMGAPPLTGGEASALISRMKRAAESNPEQAAATLAAIKENPYAGQIMQQLTGKGGLDESFKSAFYAASDDAAASMVSNFKKENKEALYASITPEEKKSLRDITNKEFATTKSAFNAIGPWAKNNRFSESLKEAVMLEAINIKNSGDVKLEDAYAQASEKIVNDHYHIVGTSFIPKQIGDVVTSRPYIEGEMQAIHNPDYQKKLNLEVPLKMAVPGETPEQKKARIASSEKSLRLAIEKGRWVTRPDTLGARFMIPRGNKWQPLMKKDGSTVDIDFAKSSVSPSPDAVEFNKPWFEKIMR